MLKNAENVNGVKLEFGTFLGHSCYNLLTGVERTGTADL